MPEGISFEGISSMYHDLLKGKQMGRSYERETVALCFSGNGQRLYHITKARSAEHRMSLDCQVEVALWNVGDIHDVKHVANSRITKRVGVGNDIYITDALLQRLIHSGSRDERIHYMFRSFS